MSLNATISRILESERFPKSASDWVVPATAAAVLVLGASLIFKGGNNERRPPKVWSWIPWVGSDWAIEKDPDAFFEAAEKNHPDGIFTIKAAGQTFHVLTSAALINHVYKQPKIYHICLLQLSWGRNVFSFSERVLTETAAILGQLSPALHRSFSPNHMMALVEAFHANLAPAVKTLSVPGGSVSLEHWLTRLAYRTTGAAIYGPTFDADGTFDDFKGFDDWVWKVALGYPPTYIPSFIKSREAIIRKFQKYAEEPHDASDYVATQEHIARDGQFSERDIGVVLLAAWWPLMANIPWGSLWALLLQLQRPEALGPLMEELDKAGDAWSAAHPEAQGTYLDHLPAFFQSTEVPLLSSIIAEAMRYSSDAYSMRGVLVDEAQLAGYTLKKDEYIICRTRAVHQDPTEYPSPHEYIPTRFMGEQGRAAKEGNPMWMPFGGGRHFAAYHVKILITTLVKNFDFEIDHSNIVWAEDSASEDR
ncbi:Cytochrome P450 7B1 [Tulasnella sp. 403]|nr:Cytochrome P450 7B1 [Tulasnella sp. 403]